jgi:hypothetical protein
MHALHVHCSAYVKIEIFCSAAIVRICHIFFVFTNSKQYSIQILILGYEDYVRYNFHVNTELLWVLDKIKSGDKSK